MEEGTATRVVMGVTWASGAPEVRLRDGGAQSSTHEPLVGLTLNYQTDRDGTRLCLGKTPFRSADGPYYDCQNPPERASRLCTSCSISDATFASNLHHAHTKDRTTIDPAIAEHLRQPNVLYLAAFRDGSIKVGTSTAHRSEKRLSEQGAWRALIMADTADGYAVRDLEDRVTADLDIPQSVSIGRKLDGMATPLPDERLDEELAWRADEVTALIERMADSRVETRRDPWTFPTAADRVWSGLHRYPLRLDSGQHDLEVVVACGRMVAVRRRSTDDTFIADVGQLYGLQLTLGDYASDELAVQESLF